MTDAGYVPADIAEAEAQLRRGPLRPEQLLSVRKRQGRRLGAHGFRAFDVLFLSVATAVAIRLLIEQPLLRTTVGEDLPFVVGALFLVRLLRSAGLYRFGRNERLASHAARLVACIVGAMLAWVATRGLIGGTQMSIRRSLRWAAVCGLGLAALHLLWWLIVKRWRRQGWLTPNVVIVGATTYAEGLIMEAITSTDMHVLGIFDDRAARSPKAVLGVPVLGDTDALLSHKITPFVDLIVVAVDPLATERVRAITARLAVLPNPVTLIFDPNNAAGRAAAIAQLADAPLSPLNATTDTDRKAFAKRVQDLVIGVPMLIVLTPLLMLVALAVRLDSAGPVFFRQRRHGFNNEEINVWKFRSMRHAAADAKAERQVTANDDRVTRVGRVLRSTSLDELPQLFNVIHGEMSLVGPRPHAIGMKTGDVESARLVAEYAHRHRIKPGMTGWAAIKGSRGPLNEAAEVSKRVALDVDYIDRQSFWLDLNIMVRTVPGMLGDRHAVR